MKFRGHAHRSLDPKGRLMLPPEYRDRVLAESGAGKAVLSIMDGCVVGFTMNEWERIEKEMSKLKSPSRRLRNFVRKFISGAEETALDKQGRIKIPAHLMEYGRLAKEVVLAGVGEHFEIWDKEEFGKLLNEQDIDDVSEELSELGINLPI